MENAHYGDYETDQRSDQRHACALAEINERAEDYGKRSDNDAKQAEQALLVLVFMRQNDGQLVRFGRCAVEIGQDGNDRKLYVTGQQKPDNTDHKSKCR